ncbi:MAG: HAD family hydrolase [Thermodesulfobacteriota bacterium]|jgi:putative hydrolase of the HAD superfamily|nr:HAD family hydrolase [Thermodesulfobacteriota bacterium]
MLTDLSKTRSIVFDLDGTLYVCPQLGKQIEEAAVELVAESRGVSRERGREILARARSRLTDIFEEQPTLTRTCIELGIEIREFHQMLQYRVRPEQYLDHDPVLVALLDSLREQCDLYIYTNNSLPLSHKILSLLGVEEMFARIYTIEFGQAPKPDPEAFRRVLEDIGGPPESFLFVGDRAAIDLKLPAHLGIPTLLVGETADLLQIHKLLGIIP